VPFKSRLQQKYLHWKKPEGVNLKEWDKKTDFSKLPEKAKKARDKMRKKKANFMVGSTLLGSLLGGGAGAYMAPEGKGWEGAGLGALAGGGLGLGKGKLLKHVEGKGSEALKKVMDTLRPTINAYNSKLKFMVDDLKGMGYTLDQIEKDPKILEHLQRQSAFASEGQKKIDPIISNVEKKRLALQLTPAATIGGGLAGAYGPSEETPMESLKRKLKEYGI
jgi:hypothetical protein